MLPCFCFKMVYTLTLRAFLDEISKFYLFLSKSFNLTEINHFLCITASRLRFYLHSFGEVEIDVELWARIREI